MAAVGGGGGSVPIYLTKDLEKLQRRGFRIIHPTLLYAEVLTEADVVSFLDSRQDS